MAQRSVANRWVVHPSEDNRWGAHLSEDNRLVAHQLAVSRQAVLP